MSHKVTPLWYILGTKPKNIAQKLKKGLARDPYCYF